MTLNYLSETYSILKDCEEKKHIPPGQWEMVVTGKLCMSSLIIPVEQTVEDNNRQSRQGLRAKAAEL